MRNIIIYFSVCLLTGVFAMGSANKTKSGPKQKQYYHSKNQSWWLGMGSLSSSNTIDLSPLKDIKNKSSFSLNLDYLYGINEDLAFDTYLKYLQDNTEESRGEKLFSQIMLGARLQFHLSFESFRLFVGPSLASVFMPAQHGLSPKNSFSYATHFGIQFELFESHWSIENHKTYLLTGTQQGGSYNELFLKYRVL